MSDRNSTTIDAVLLAALEDLAGAAVVLDARLSILHATPEAESLIGTSLPRGLAIVKALCGEGENRPIADALASGKAAVGLVVRPAPDGTQRTLRVQTAPVLREGQRIGWLILLELDSRSALGGEDAVLFHGMWTRDPSMKRMFHIVERAARREASVLVRGPTGTGKELVARAIHDLSARRDGAFRAINCAALPPNLLESELFGHVKGSFTGAVRDNAGIFRAAHGGTLFLDEIGEMPLELQAKLLRVLETRTVIPVGGSEPVDVDVRIVAATHQSLRRAVEDGRFRADLMYRLRVVPIFLPPLAERPGDIELIAEKLVNQLNAEGGRQVARISKGARRALVAYPWPGNVRELRNALEYAYVIGDGSVLLETELPPEVAGRDEEIQLNAPVDQHDPSPEGRRIRQALERAGGSRERAAQLLGMSRVTLWRRMKTLGLIEATENEPDES